MKFELGFNHFHSRKCISKYRLQSAILSRPQCVNVRKNNPKLNKPVNVSMACTSHTESFWEKICVRFLCVQYWPFVRGIHWSPVDSLHKGTVMRTEIFDKLVNKPSRGLWSEKLWRSCDNTNSHGRQEPNRLSWSKSLLLMAWQHNGTWHQQQRFPTKFYRNIPASARQRLRSFKPWNDIFQLRYNLILTTLSICHCDNKITFLHHMLYVGIIITGDYIDLFITDRCKNNDRQRCLLIRYNV